MLRRRHEPRHPAHRRLLGDHRRRRQHPEMGLQRQRAAQRPDQRLERHLRRRHPLHLQRRRRLRRPDRCRLDLRRGRAAARPASAARDRLRRERQLRTERSAQRRRHARRRRLSQRARHHLLVAVRHDHRLRRSRPPARTSARGTAPVGVTGALSRPGAGDHLPLPPRRPATADGTTLRIRLQPHDVSGQCGAAGRHGRAGHQRHRPAGPDLTASTGTWNPAPSSYAYQWQRSTDGGNTWTNIAGADGRHLPPRRRGRRRATSGRPSSRRTPTATRRRDSAPDGPIASGAPFDTSPPHDQRHARDRVRRSTSAQPGTRPAASYSYQWQRSAERHHVDEHRRCHRRRATCSRRPTRG